MTDLVPFHNDVATRKLAGAIIGFARTDKEDRVVMEVFLDPSKILRAEECIPLYDAFENFLKGRGIDPLGGASGMCKGVAWPDFYGPKVIISIKASDAPKFEVAYKELAPGKQLGK